MTDAPYRGFLPVDDPAQAKSLAEDEQAVLLRLRQASEYMAVEAPLMAVAAGLIRNVHRTLDAATVEEGFGPLAHRIQISHRLKACFVVFPAVLSGTQAEDFLSVVGPAGDHMVIAADGYEDDLRGELAARWPGSITLLTFAGTEHDHRYRLHEG